MDEQIERNGKTYRKMKVGELVQKGDIMNGILGWTEAFAGTSYEVANHGACYYREVQPDEKPETSAPIEDGGPAFSVAPTMNLDGSVWYHGKDGMTLRQYAAIKLCVPKSGLEWLDDMIRESQCNEFAGRALAGFAANPRMIDSRSPATLEIVSEWSFEAADAMIKARREVQHG
jgi:hypothetical protein